MCQPRKLQIYLICDDTRASIYIYIFIEIYYDIRHNPKNIKVELVSVDILSFNSPLLCCDLKYLTCYKDSLIVVSKSVMLRHNEFSSLLFVAVP